MGGHLVPYHLRTNKYVERQLFLDALDYVRVWNGPAQYVYASMGGPFLEDFKQINDRFAIENMMSLEMHFETWERQKFNSPLGFIRCRNETSSTFIENFDLHAGDYPDCNFIVWLDYANAKDRFDQLQEFESLAAKMGCGDVIKITLNANHESLMKRSDYKTLTDRQFNKLLIEDLEDQLGGYIPEGGVQAEHLKAKSFAKLMAGCVEMAAKKATESSELTALPLISCRYNDHSHQMLTVTAVIVTDELSSKISNDQNFQAWEFQSKEWTNVFEVKVPQLSMTERAAINRLINKENDAHSIFQKLNIRFGDKDSESIALLRNYVTHYRRYPGFGRIQA